MDDNKNMNQENKDQKVVEFKKKGFLDKVKEGWKKTPESVKILGAIVVGGAATLAGVWITGKSDSPIEAVPDVIDVACDVKDVIPDVVEDVAGTVEVTEF